MKFTCTKNELANALRIVSKAIANKPQTPVLAGIYVRAENNQLELQATNYELGFVSRIQAEVETPGQIAIGGRYFLEVVNKMPGDTITISLDDDARTVHIQSEKVNFTLLSMNPAEFPVIRPLDGNLQFTIKDNVLRTLIKKTSFACSTDEGKPVFTGCSLVVDGTEVTMAASNMHRLSVMKETFDEPIGSIRIIIPAKILNEILHSASSDIPSDITITCSYNQISFVLDNLYMTSRLIEGTFPSYSRVIPNSFATHVQVDTAAFTAALDRVSLIARSDEYNVVKMDFRNKQVHLMARNPEVGDADEYVSAEIDGPDVQTAFNAQYFIDVMKALDSSVCRIGLNQELSPAAVREADNDKFIYVVTPVRTAH